MSHQYQAVLWNRQKRLYDTWLLLGIVACLALFSVTTLILIPTVTAETVIIRATGATAFAMLTFILCIGPLARLNPKFLPLLYNRRHFGVSMFLIAATHGVFNLIQFHSLGDVNPITSVLTWYPLASDSPSLPFQLFGFVALMILFAMAATSHDFWLANLTAPVWKALHMSVYVAYLLILIHTTFGALQDQGNGAISIVLLSSATLVTTLHLLSGWKGRGIDMPSPSSDLWVAVGKPEDIENNKAVVVTAAGERIAVFRFGPVIAALSAVCQHQNGPLGEACIIDGLITCPWHGYQYDPLTGASPAPFNERVPTFDVRSNNGIVEVAIQPNSAGTASKTLHWQKEM